MGVALDAFDAHGSWHDPGLTDPEHHAEVQPIRESAAGTLEGDHSQNMFAHLLFGGPTGLCEEDVADTAAKVNTWRTLPARSRCQMAELLLDML